MSTVGAPLSPRIGIDTIIGGGCCWVAVEGCSCVPAIVGFDLVGTKVSCCIGWLQSSGDSGAIGTEKFGISDSSEDRWFNWGSLGSEIRTNWNDGMRDSICEHGDDGRSVGKNTGDDSGDKLLCRCSLRGTSIKSGSSESSDGF